MKFHMKVIVPLSIYIFPFTYFYYYSIFYYSIDRYINKESDK